MLKRSLLVVTAAIGGWMLYWSGYARGLKTASYLVYDQQLADTMVSLSLRQLFLAQQADASHCDVDTIVRLQIDDLALKERDLSRAVGWRDLVFGMRGTEELVRSRQRRTVGEIRKKFQVDEEHSQTC